MKSMKKMVTFWICWEERLEWIFDLKFRNKMAYFMICLIRFLGNLNRTMERMKRIIMKGRGERMAPNEGQYWKMEQITVFLN